MAKYTILAATAAMISTTFAAQFVMYTPGGDDTVVERADPIISPGSVSGHVHQVFGASAFTPELSYDALQASDDHLNLSDVGQRIVLPSSYRGGPRDMYQRFLDGMAVARHFKKVDIFLTMTANPAWPEITRELLPHQSASDRPELISRVFRLKQKALLDLSHCPAATDRTSGLLFQFRVDDIFRSTRSVLYDSFQGPSPTDVLSLSMCLALCRHLD